MPSQWVYTNKVVVVPPERIDLQAILLSAFFDLWIDEFGGSMGRSTRVMKLAPVLGTFPLPAIEASTDQADSWQAIVHRNLDAGTVSANALLDQVHDGENTSHVANELRSTMQSIDSSVRDAYGWGDLDLRYGFYSTKFGIRFTLAPNVRRDALTRLVALNHERYAEEVRQGLHDRPKVKRRAAAPAALSFDVGDA